jgi:hypothetical protein
MEQVIWMPVKGYEERYLVSNDGRVKSLDIYVNCKNGKRLYEGRIKPQYTNNRGYLTVALCKDNKTVRALIHRIVAEAFICNPNNLPQVNHIDGDPTNNHASNLEWVTDNENKKHSSIDVGGTQRPKRAVVVTDTVTGKIFHFGGVREAERVLNLDHGTVVRLLKGRGRTYKGYAIAYAEGVMPYADTDNSHTEREAEIVSHG